MADPKLTKAQRALLGMIADPCFKMSGLSVYGPREFRTARSLDLRGLARLDVYDHLRITPAGRAALEQGGGRG